MTMSNSIDNEFEVELVWCIKSLEKKLMQEMSKVRERNGNYFSVILVTIF